MTLPPPLTLTYAAGRITVYEHGAHLVSWTPVGSDPVIWMSAKAQFDPGTAIRGGVPIVFPWFGAGRTGDASPAHGFARLRPWRVQEARSADDFAVAAFVLEGDGDDPLFPHHFAAEYRVRAGAALHLTLTVENSGDEPFSYEAALHAYLAVGDVRDVVIEGLAGSSYFDQVAPGGGAFATQEGDIRVTAETDRIYASSGQVRVVDERLGRCLVIDKHGSASTVVWNPWIDKARRMTDFGDDEWKTMVCIEGGNLRDSAVDLAPGQRHEMSYVIRLEHRPPNR